MFQMPALPERISFLNFVGLIVTNSLLISPSSNIVLYVWIVFCIFSIFMNFGTI
ncbi:hypothetical protein D3C81_1490840 [compost metagenome]